MNVRYLQELSNEFCVPFEDVLFIALNLNGVDFDCGYDRMRAQLHLGSDNLFRYAQNREDLDFYFALPVHTDSPFKLRNDTLTFDGYTVGTMSGTTEDICNSHYWRRGKTSLNINPNRRTKCHGCEFCYAVYQVPKDNNRLITESDFSSFFETFLSKYELDDLSNLIEISVVTGCYDDGQHLLSALRNLKKVAEQKYSFCGRLFYLGSQINSTSLLDEFADLGKTRLCYSIETFERREILKPLKRNFEVMEITNLMDYARTKGIEINFAYVLGLEPLEVVKRYFKEISYYINVFPIVNILQLHRKQSQTLRTSGADDVRFYLESRKIIEEIYLKTDLRPEVWNDYRSLWTLKFANENLTGVRIP